MRLARKVAMVTGAAQGIGAAIAGEFAKEGAVVYALDRSPRLEATCTQICEAGGKAFTQAKPGPEPARYRPRRRSPWQPAGARWQCWRSEQRPGGRRGERAA